jgi:hypothetical protein
MGPIGICALLLQLHQEPLSEKPLLVFGHGPSVPRTPWSGSPASEAGRSSRGGFSAEAGAPRRRPT